jgi:hypothetical protein
MSDDALERLKKRKRPTVKNRETHSISNQDIQISRYQDIQTLEKQEDQKVTFIKPEQKNSEKKNSNDSTDQTSKYPDTSIPEQKDTGIKTKQSTLRLEERISEKLSQICQEAGFCREVFIEALIEHYHKHHNELGEIINEARKKAELRMEVANQKRAKSMMKKFNSSQ